MPAVFPAESLLSADDSDDAIVVDDAAPAAVVRGRRLVGQRGPSKRLCAAALCSAGVVAFVGVLRSVAPHARPETTAGTVATQSEAVLYNPCMQGELDPAGMPCQVSIDLDDLNDGASLYDALLTTLTTTQTTTPTTTTTTTALTTTTPAPVVVVVPKCSVYGENCHGKKCCEGAGMQCFVKDAGWAACRASCVPGPDPVADDGGPWSCDPLGPRTAGNAPVCSKVGEDCRSSQCCAETGMQCYEKVPGWATCKPQCEPGMDLTDIDSTPWSCKPLGVRTPGPASWVPQVCAAPGAGCLDKQCCSVPGQQCFEKNPFWGECLETCDASSWSCKTRGQRTPLPPPPPGQGGQPKLAAWVATTCSAAGEDCSVTQCCSAPGSQCFQKNASYAVCRGSCQPGLDLYDADAAEWWCHPIGPRTPGVAMAADPWQQGKKVAAWVEHTCAAANSDDCRQSKCCKDAGKQCYEKNGEWAACMMGCTPGPLPGDDGGGDWTCKELGPRTHATWGTPSLYCYSAVRKDGYEPGLLAATMGSGAGIFACDQYSVFSTDKFSLGFGPNGPVETVTFVPAPVVTSKDHTAGNALLFMHVWDAVRDLGLWRTTDWTVKVDPDAVLLPERLRWHTQPHTGQSVYVVNCAKPFMPEGPMMFGALEAFSRPAIETYFSKSGDCYGGLPWNEWGEDLYMGKCLDKLGVQRALDFHIYSDGVCTGVDCTDPDAAAFHPKKDVGSWMSCLEETKHPVPRTITEAPQWFKDYMASYTR